MKKWFIGVSVFFIIVIAICVVIIRSEPQPENLTHPIGGHYVITETTTTTATTPNIYCPGSYFTK